MRNESLKTLANIEVLVIHQETRMYVLCSFWTILCRKNM